MPLLMLAEITFLAPLLAPPMVLLPPRANEYTVAQVAQGMETGRVGTDEVSLNHVPGRRTAVEIDALSAIARDDVTCTDGRAPHRVVGSAEYVDAVMITHG